MMQLFLEALDVWLFRDGRPFDAGSDHRAESMFPPYPSVVQGAIRSHQLALLGINLTDAKAIEDAVGTATDFKELRLRGPVVARRRPDGSVIRYFPLPADAIPCDDQGHYRSLSPQPKPENVLTSAPTPQLLMPVGAPCKEKPGPWWMDKDNLKRCLAGQEAQAVRSSELFERESRFGIGLDSQPRVTKEGALYEVEFIRPGAGVGLLVEVDGYDNWPAEGVLRLGGEGHAARFYQLNETLAWPAPPDPLPRRFKVYFATPTYFENGWQPDNWDRFFTGKVTLQAAAVRRYESIGGFDLATGDHKPARRFVPAGSVYFFECTGQAKLNPKLVQNAITDFGAEIGFGQIIIKEW